MFVLIFFSLYNYINNSGMKAVEVVLSFLSTYKKINRKS